MGEEEASAATLIEKRGGLNVLSVPGRPAGELKTVDIFVDNTHDVPTVPGSPGSSDSGHICHRHYCD